MNWVWTQLWFLFHDNRKSDVVVGRVVEAAISSTASASYNKKRIKRPLTVDNFF